jgi:acyl-coenzyme A synthetase/AMP-(fatty) acid ligase
VSADKAQELPGSVRGIVPGSFRKEASRIEGVPTDIPILYLFTSGSTGRPTLVPKLQEQIAVEVDFISGLFEAPKRVAGLVPWCHIWGLLTSFFVPFYCGGVCDLRGGISARGVLELVAASALDLVAAVPVYYKAMVKLMAAGLVSVPPDAAKFTSASAPLGPETRAAFYRLSGCNITDIYGSTEAGGIAYRHDDGPWIPEPHVEMRVDADGLLDVRSPSVSLPGEDGFFSTGDLIRKSGDGFVLLGRGDDVVKIGGRRIALGEISTAIETLSGVARAAVLTEQVSGSPRLVAVVESDGEVTASAVKAHVRTRLADHKVPRVVRFLERLPMTPSGKFDRQRIASLLAARKGQS